MLYEVRRKNQTSIYVQVDEEVVESISRIKWCYGQVTKTKGYVLTNYCKDLGSTVKDRKKTIYLHKYVYELVNGPIESGLFVDHINGDTLDCRIKNLRLMSDSGNNANKISSTSKYIGVRYITSYTKSDGTMCSGWCAVMPKYLSNTGYSQYIGYSTTEEGAAELIRDHLGATELLVRSVHQSEDNIWNGTDTAEYIELEIEKIKQYRQSISQIRPEPLLSVESDLIEQYQKLIKQSKSKIKQLLLVLDNG